MNDEAPPTWPETFGRAGAALVPDVFGGAAVAIVVEDVIARRRAKAAEFLSVLTEGVDEGTLRARLADDRVGTLVSNAGDAAVRSAQESKRKALAKVARNALDDDAKVDESELVVQVLSSFEAPHVAALTRLAAVDAAHPVAFADVYDSRDEDDFTASPNLDDLRVEMMNASQAENPAVMAVLRAAGVVIPSATYDSIARYDAGALTPLGHLVIEALRVG